MYLESQQKITSTCIVAEPRREYQANFSQSLWAEILVDSTGIEKLLTYAIPPDLNLKLGDIVSVPLRKDIVGGIVIKISVNPPEDLDIAKIRPIEDLITSGFFPDRYWELLEKVADYYLTDLINGIRVALPPGLLGKSQRRIRLQQENIPPGFEEFCSYSAIQVINLLEQSKERDYSVNYIRSKVKGSSRGLRDLVKRGWVESYLEPPKKIKPKTKTVVTSVTFNLLSDLTKKQREVLQILNNNGGEMWKKDLIDLMKESGIKSPSVLNTIADKGYIIFSDREILRKEQGIPQKSDKPKQLNIDQAKALEVINNRSGFTRILLHGVTGSGKTEVYLQAIEPILEEGKSALVLVPEIGLTPQLTDRFRSRFGEKVCVYHSKLSKEKRYDTWRETIQGEPQVIIGTRSAIFAPLPKLGLIVLDEEHDSSFKQARPTPTYHARTVASWRAELANCPLVLGSATPSLESLVTAKETNNKIDVYLSLPERIGSRPLPPVEIVDMREELNKGNYSIFSHSLQKALSEIKEKQQQAILFIPRRGHSTFVSCRSCGHVMECPSCDVSLSYHYAYEGATKLLRCHYCNHSTLQPEKCPQCNSPYLKFFGSGTQKVILELNKLFPELTSIRFDSDTVKNNHRDLIARFIAKEADILVGTQMLTKGLDISGVTLVGVVSADGLLYRSDYRSNETAFQTLTQVAGRAGRGEEPGKVIVQTYSPKHTVIKAVKNHDYNSFSKTELEQRLELDYPPYGKLIVIKLSSKDENKVRQSAEILANACLDIIPEDWSLLGPAPASVMKVANRYRWQILLKFPNSNVNLRDLNSLRSKCLDNVSMTIDVDPINMD